MSSIAPFGDRGVLVTCGDRFERLLVSRALASALPDASVRVGTRSVLVVVDRPVVDLDANVRKALADHAGPSDTIDAQPRLVSIEVCYDGADLADVAARLGISVQSVIDAHTAQVWVVDLMGFAPGFGYLIPKGAPTADWSQLSRRDSPRQHVPAGSVAVAAGMSAVYPAGMPGGWNLVGQTSVTLFDPSLIASPSLLMPGTQVRFVPVAS